MIVDPHRNQISDPGYMPHKELWNTCRGNISEEDFDRIAAYFNNKIDDLLSKPHLAPVVEAAWITTDDWTNIEDIMPLYYAAREDKIIAGYFAGLMLWHVLSGRDDAWVLWDDPARGVRQYFMAYEEV